MSEIEISLKDFIKSTAIGINDKDCFSQTVNKIINFYRDRDQHDSYIVNDKDIYGSAIDLNLTLNDKELFYTYGIRLLSYVVEAKIDRRYILIIPSKYSLSDYKSSKFKEEYNKAIIQAKRNIPEDAINVDFADDNKLVSYNDFQTRIKLVSEHFPNSNPLYAENGVKAKHSYKSNGIKILENYKKDFDKYTSSKLKPAFIDITNIVNTDEIINYVVFRNKCSEIKQLIRAHEGCMAVLYYDNNPDYLKIFNAFAVHFQYFYNVQSVLYGEAEDYIQDLTELYYNETEMLMEDRIKYILNFPTYTYRLGDIIDSYFLALARRCEGRVSICPIDDLKPENIVKINNFDFAKNNIVPLSSLYPLYKNKVMKENNVIFTHLDTISNYRKISNLFVDFENVLNLEGVCLDISNTCLVKYNNKIYICYVEELKAHIKGFRYIEDMQFEKQTVFADGMEEQREALDFSYKMIELQTKDIGKYTPIDTFADAYRYKVILTNKFRVPIKKLHPDFDDSKKVYKGKSALTLSSKLTIPIRKFFDSFVINNSYYLFETDELLELFHELGLHYSELFRFRLNGVSAILDSAPRRSFRDNNYMTVSIDLEGDVDVNRLLSDNSGVKVDEFYNENNEIYKKVITFSDIPVIGMYGGVHTYVDSSDNNRIIITEKFLAREFV